MSNLVNHAKLELELLGEGDWIKSSVLKCVEAFSDAGHSGSSAEHTIYLLERLLRFQNLTPLTDRPQEWMEVGIHGDVTVWQNMRNSEAFSHDGGKHYYLLSEGGNDRNPFPLHESSPKYGK
jgi:hypothetical protein